MTKSDKGKIFLAVLPLLSFVLGFRQAFWLGFLTALHVWFAALFFKITAPLYPERLKKWALLLWIGAAAQIGFYLWNLPPLWAASLYLLFPQEVFQRCPEKELHKKIFWLGAGFWMVVLCLGIRGEILERKLSMSFFEHPAGLLMALGFLAALAFTGFPFIPAAEKKGRAIS